MAEKKRNVTGRAGATGDLLDRLQGAYKPNANPVPAQPLDSLIIKGDRLAKQIAAMIAQLSATKPKKPATTPPPPRKKKA